MPLINYEINLKLNWSTITDSTDAGTFTLTDTKLYVPVVTLFTEDNTKPLEQLKSGLKRAINWNKYQSRVTPQTQNQYLGRLFDLSFQGVNRLFVTANLWSWSKSDTEN